MTIEKKMILEIKLTSISISFNFRSVLNLLINSHLSRGKKIYLYIHLNFKFMLLITS